MLSLQDMIAEINQELQSDDMPFKACCICGEPFVPKRGTQVTCGSKDCVTAHKRDVTRAWYDRRGSYQRQMTRKRAREYMRAKRKAERENR